MSLFEQNIVAQFECVHCLENSQSLALQKRGMHQMSVLEAARQEKRRTTDTMPRSFRAS